MLELLVELNRTRIDAGDMRAVLAILGELDTEARPTRQRADGPGDGWTLRLRLVPSGPVPQRVVRGLVPAAVRVREHFTGRGKVPPSRLMLLDPDNTPLMSVKI